MTDEQIDMLRRLIQDEIEVAGVDGMEQMHESADFLREKIKKYWPNYQPR